MVKLQYSKLKHDILAHFYPLPCIYKVISTQQVPHVYARQDYIYLTETIFTEMPVSQKQWIIHIILLQSSTHFVYEEKLLFNKG